MSKYVQTPTAATRQNLRDLGDSERLFWWMNQNRTTHFAEAAELSGKATEAQWSDALRHLQRRHPLLSASIVPGESGQAVFAQVAGAEIPLRIVEASEPLPWEAELERELVSRFDGTQAPLLRATVVQGERRSVLILLAHHSISDGLSMTYLIRDVLTALGGTVLTPLALLPSKEAILRSLPSAAQEPGTPPRPETPPLQYAAEDAKWLVGTATIRAQQTTTLRERARNEGVTVHAALCAAAVCAGREALPEWRERPVRIACPVSYRKALGVGEQNGYYIGPGTVRLSAEPTSFWELARSAKEQLAAAPSLAAAQTFAGVMHRLMNDIHEVAGVAALAAGAFASDLILTNVGEVAFDTGSGPLQLEALWGPALVMGFAGLPVLGAATTHGSLRLLVTGDAPCAWLLPGMERFLQEACG